MLSTDCYPHDVLHRYLRGDIDDTLGDSIALHLRSCEVCEDTVSELDSVDDTLIRTLTLKSNSPPATPEWIERVAVMEPDCDQPTTDPQSGSSGEMDDDGERSKRFGDYELLGTLGRGGMSVVFAARHRHLGREVALKVLMPASQQHVISRERFSREMRVVGGLTHSSIIRATDAGEFQDTLYLVMEKIDGVDLKHAARNEGVLSIADVCEIGSQVARGLQHAHAQGVIHRDIKPSNLMLDRDGNIKILDFGLARVQSGQDVTLQTTIGQLLGTLDYMAPEQAGGSDIAAQADIYALGATIFKLLTGAAPHGRSADVPILEFLHRLANESAPRLDTKREQVPAALCDLLESMLHRDPNQRESSAEVVAERLSEFAKDADLVSLVGRVPNQFQPTLKNPRGATSTDEAIAAPAVSSSRSPVGPIGWTALALASASFVGLVLLGVSMLLKTPEGDFRIESDVLDSLLVEVVDANDRVESIAVNQGKAETTLQTGRYRIRLGAASDEVKLSPNVITISKDNTAIAKITRTESTRKPGQGLPGASPNPLQPTPRDPNVAASALLELQATMEAMRVARQQQNPDEEVLKTLGEQIAQLRALSRPIPTEPVYKGRTLADWTAQMRFERDGATKREAAYSVLALVYNLPPTEKVAIYFEVYARLARLKDNSNDTILRGLLASKEKENTFTRRYKRFDRDVACKYINKQLRSKDAIFRRHALESCLYLKHEIRDGKWPGTINALQDSASMSDELQPLGQFTYAICQADPESVSKEIVKVDLTNASLEFISAMLAALNDARFSIPKSFQIDWTIQYLSHEDGRLTDFQRGSLGGPLTSIEFDNVTEEQQTDIDAIASALLDQLEQQAFSDPTDAQAIASKKTATAAQKVSMFLREASLGEAQAKRAIDLMQRRIEQLVTWRDQSNDTSKESLKYIDYPSSHANSILLLGGEVPKSLKDRPKTTSPYFRALLPTGSSLDRISNAYQSYGWFPYQALAVSDNPLTKDGSMATQLSYSRRSSIVRDLVDSVGIPIVLDWFSSEPDNSDTAGLVSKELLKAIYKTPIRSKSIASVSLTLRCHPRWQKRIRDIAMTSKSDPQVSLAIELLKQSDSAEQISLMHRKWLDGNDVQRTRHAIGFFVSLTTAETSKEPSKELLQAIAKAFERNSKNGPLSAREMEDLLRFNELYNLVPNAPQYAREFLQALIAQQWPPKSLDDAIDSAYEILKNAPDEIEKMESDLRAKAAGYTPKRIFATKDFLRQVIARLLTVLDRSRNKGPVNAGN